jgi:rhodanese-related sulfurtransferase
VQLAKDAGLKIGETGGIYVDQNMRTSDTDIFAAGDCVEISNRLLETRTLAPYGDLANLQGRVAGENAVLDVQVGFPGTLHTGICKVFDYTAGSTGLSADKAKAAGYNVVTGVNASLDKPGFMNGRLLISKMVVDADSGRLLGYQCLGPGDVSRQLSTAAMALSGRQTITELANADLPYAPPFSLALDHFITAAHIVENKLKGRMKGISVNEVKAKLDSGAKPFLLDTRSQAEYEGINLKIGEHLIPIDELHSRLEELPRDKDQEIICYCKISMRGYEAQRVLEYYGWKNVKVMEGGVMAWPYSKST